MKRLLVDTSVVLDVLLEWQPYAETSAALWGLIETHGCQGYLTPHAITTIQSLARGELGVVRTKRLIASILRVFRVAPVDSKVLEEALRLHIGEFEDAVTMAAAISSHCEYVVTRDPSRFKGAPVRALAPEAALPIVGGE